MPIAVACKACGSKYNVPDQLAGRSAKCKCGSPIAVPAAGGRPMQAAAPRPGAARAAPARQAPVEQEIQIGDGDVVEVNEPSPLGSFSLDSLDGLEVPPKMQAKIREEIKPTEKILWMGRPLMSYAKKKTWIAFWAGWFFLAIGVGVLAWGGVGFFTKDDNTPPIMYIVMAVIGSAFTLFGLLFVTMPFWYGRLAHYRDVYILTDQRAITFDYEMLVKCTVKSFTAAQMTEFGATEYGDIRGAGDLKFCTEMIDMGYRTSHGKDYSTGQRTITHKQERAPRDRGFLMIENVRKVAALVRQTLFNKSGPPGPRR